VDFWGWLRVLRHSLYFKVVKMGYSKYTSKERLIARKITDLKGRKTISNTAKVVINILIDSLNGKYAGDKMPVEI